MHRSSRIPDCTTFWTFRQRLKEAGAAVAIFAAVRWKLTQHGYLARCGQIDDATLITEPIQRNSKVEQEPIMQDAQPADWTSARRRQRDVQATWTEKDGRSQFGYKFSASVDRRRTLICMVKVSTASDHATHHLEGVLDATNISRDVDRDKGYIDWGRETRLPAPPQWGTGWKSTHPLGGHIP